ncbi:MAG: SDR family oxidoreductase [Chloroflexi bacterium]|nr:SDR family oxidoreductase [Chloroflexota bacterium]
MEKWALITGASSGIGEAFARQLAAKGYDLCLTGRRAERLEAVAAEVRNQHEVRAEVVVADIGTDAGIRLLEKWISVHTPIEMLVNNAGFGVRTLFTQDSPEKTIEMIAVHNIAPVRLTSAVLDGMKQAGRGSIINVSSPAAYAPLPGNGAYAGTKAFLNAFSESLARELEGTGIRVQILLPGYTYSDFHKRPAYDGSDTYNSVPKFMWLTSEYVARSSLKALEHGGLYCTPSLLYKLLVLAGRLGLTRFVRGSILKRLGRDGK